MDGSSEVGQILLGKYRIESVLGQGGMGIVVAARHMELGKRVAIKILLPQAMEYPGACERFVREARAAARVEGEHIAQVHDTGRLEDGTPYILMEYLEGQDLKRVVRERGALPAEEAARYVLQACDAVAEAHKHGIVHRDLKPGNMMLVRRASGQPSVKVLDFGISKNVDPAARIHDLTQSGVIMCSPSYMAPEQVLHPKEVDPRSDIWALGVVLYELVTGKLPFHADTGLELLGQILQRQPTRPTNLVPSLSDDVERVILRCIEKDREKRFQTVAELMDALRPFVVADLVQEMSKKLPHLLLDVPCPDWFEPTYKKELDAPAKAPTGHVESVAPTLSDAETDETRTHALPPKQFDRTPMFSNEGHRRAPTAAITDECHEVPRPVVEKARNVPPRRRRYGALAITVSAATTAIIGGLMLAQPMNEHAEIRKKEGTSGPEAMATAPVMELPTSRAEGARAATNDIGGDVLGPENQANVRPTTDGAEWGKTPSTGSSVVPQMANARMAEGVLTTGSLHVPARSPKPVKRPETLDSTRSPFTIISGPDAGPLPTPPKEVEIKWDPGVPGTPGN